MCINFCSRFPTFLGCFLSPLSGSFVISFSFFSFLSIFCLISDFNKDTVTRYLDWLLKNHFDFRGLIEKGLAIEVNENNNPYKE